MSEWVKFDGSEEQINEMRNAPHGWKIKYKCGVDSDVYFGKPDDDDIQAKLIASYLIVEPHPHADMIIEWARTGRPVYHKASDGKWYLDSWPHWVSNGEYSFDPPRKIKYKRYLVDSRGDGFTTIAIEYYGSGVDHEKRNGFIRWIDEEWQEVEV